MVAKRAARPRDLVNIILIESEVVETGIDMNGSGSLIDRCKECNEIQSQLKEGIL
jgi:hypothetical protein